MAAHCLSWVVSQRTKTPVAPKHEREGARSNAAAWFGKAGPTTWFGKAGPKWLCTYGIRTYHVRNHVLSPAHIRTYVIMCRLAWQSSTLVDAKEHKLDPCIQNHIRTYLYICTPNLNL